MIGAPTQVTDAKGTVYTTAYGADGKVTGESIGDTVSLNYSYTNERLTKASRVAGTVTQSYFLAYDELGRLKTVGLGTGTAAAVTLVTNSCSVLGDLLSQSYGNGDSTTYTYDNLGRVKTMTEDDGTVTTYSYTSEGYLSTVESGGVTYRYVYDTLGRLISSDMGTSTSMSLQTYHEYDSSNRLTTQTLNLADQTYSSSYTYNTYGLLTKLELDDESITLTYDGLQRLQETSNSVYRAVYSYTAGASGLATTGLVSKIAYSDSVILEMLQIFSAFDLSYTYDALGNIASVTDSRNAEVSTQYGYDAQGQLLSVTEVEGEEETVVGAYSYDGAGNILTATGSDGVTHTYEYGNANWPDLLTKYDGQSITYDTIGNPTSYYNGTRWAFTWSNGRQLTQASDADDTVSVSYTYDMNGLRTGKTVGTTEHNYIYAGGKLIRESYGNTVMDFFYDQNGNPFAFTYNGTMYYYILDLQGDVIGICNSAGRMIAQYSYDAWGKVTVSATSSTNLTIANANPLRYRGYYYDTETGFYYLQSRYYDPNICRFINADGQLATGGNLTGLNLFAYCGNNPVNRIDPTGEDWWHWALGAVVVAACAVATVVTCGGVAAAVTAVCMVASGAAAGTTASTIAATAFIGAATVYGTAALSAAANSSSVEEFNEQGNWGTVAATTGGALLGGYGGYTASKTQQVTATDIYTSRGSTGRTAPQNLKEKLAMEQVQANPLDGAKQLPIVMTDSRWLATEGWIKMASNVNGVEIHFVYNTVIKVFDDFKFKG